MIRMESEEEEERNSRERNGCGQWKVNTYKLYIAHDDFFFLLIKVSK